MIKFERDDNMSIYLSFDRLGLTLLIEAIQVGLTGEIGLLEVVFDKSVTTMKRSSQAVSTRMSVERGDLTSISSDDDGVHWSIEQEDMDCLLELLSKSQTEGALETPELIRVQIPKNKRLDYLYGNMVEEVPS